MNYLMSHYRLQMLLKKKLHFWEIVNFSNVDWQPILHETDISISLNLFNKILTKIFNRHSKIMEKKVKGRKADERARPGAKNSEEN